MERTERIVVVPTEELEVEVRCGARSGVSRDNCASRRYEDLPIVRRRYLVEHLIMNGGAELTDSSQRSGIDVPDPNGFHGGVGA